MIYKLIILIFSASLISCSNIATQHNQDINFFIQTDKNAPEIYHDRGKSWRIKASIVSTITKPKTFFYDFNIDAKPNTYSITDIQHKYGNYGKWRIINKDQYLKQQVTTNNVTNINAFPITIKKSGNPHNQLFRITLNNDKNQTKHINLIFGVKKCLSKKSKEFVCF